MNKHSSKTPTSIDEQRRHFLGGSVGIGLVGAGLAAGLMSGNATATTSAKKMTAWPTTPQTNLSASNRI